ncbi:MBL fold metallo-hydrolase [Cryptosporangium arvum]|uniref:Putative Zn-dependent hydrolase of beta-lactamase fold n=1 Tax=Cryptosporangium arvum DSM 44712 TaxID=927661 RepID=A0A011ABS1_9ACTN|nr:MBL fold metallo-hydrolase [Cryptosporangium arvum]EXG79476.1 putative Zn-dependent hydrolase of beta-lactamase fold [Cryptosporangium arvum DSM 44712]
MSSNEAPRGGSGPLFAALAVTGVVASLAWAARDIPSALGARPTGARLERIRQSPRFRDGAFQNEQPSPLAAVPGGRGMIGEMLFGRQQRRPRKPVPIVTPSVTEPASTGLRTTWLGHATVLLEIEGRRVLFDPVWSERCSPSSLAGPRRLHPVPLDLAALPAVDAVVISHDHYDHLDETSIRTLTRLQEAPFLVPLGVGAHLERWGVPGDRIVELDWDETATIAGLGFTATAARHFSGRLRSDNATLWASWVVAGVDRKVFYTGDSGYFEGYETIGAAHGPFDLTLVQIGAYAPYWPDIHMTPEEGVAAHVAVNGGLLVPVHWGTFNLALHDWSEPVERLLTEAEECGVLVAVPRPGEAVDVDAPPKPDGWWRSVA